MPIDIKPSIVTALDNINKNPELYTTNKQTVPLETSINDLQKTNPVAYKRYLSTLVNSANNGNEKARILLGKIGEDGARKRRGYEGLNTAMYIPANIAIGSLTTAGMKAVPWLYKQLPQWFKTGIDAGLTVDGVRNFFSNNGIQKTYREAKAGNYRKAAISGAGDLLDFGGATKIIGKGVKAIKGINNANNMSLIHRTNYIDFTDSPALATTQRTPRSTHFTTGASVRPHGNGNWSDNTTTVIMPFKASKKHSLPSSIEPMDTFFLSLDGKFKLPKSAKVITTDSDIYNNSLKHGLRTELVTIKDKKNALQEWDNILNKEITKPTLEGYKWLERLQRLRGNKIKTWINPKIIDDATISSKELGTLTNGSDNIYFDPNFVLKSENNLLTINKGVRVRTNPNVHERHWSSKSTLFPGFDRFNTLPKFERKILYPKLEDAARDSYNTVLDRLAFSNRDKDNLFGGLGYDLDIIERFNKAKQ